MSDQTDQPKREFRFTGMTLTSTESYRPVPILPRWLNPWWWNARRRAIERVEPVVHTDTFVTTDGLWELTLRHTDMGLQDGDDHFKISRNYTLRIRATDRTEARNDAELYLDALLSDEYTLSEADE